ncbi:MAG: NAD-dependent epimerase/dehydratase family protein [Nitrospirota bacterium]
MKVFLTGASGFVGSAILKKLISAGHQVTGLIQDKENKDKITSAGGTPIVGDLLLPGPWKEAVLDHDVVISASSPFKITDKLSKDEAKRRADTHTEMIKNLLNATQGSKVQAIILTYHVTAFGSQGESWVSEVMPVKPIGLAVPIAEGYWDIEKAARKADVPVIEVFPGWTYGMGGWFSAYLVSGLTNGMPVLVGPGLNYKSLIHIDDLAEGYRLILDKMPVGERYCLVDSHPVRQKDLVDFVARELDRPTPKPTDYTLFAKQYGEVLAQTLESSVRVSNNKAKRELGFMPKWDSFCHGIPDILGKMDLLPEKREFPKAAGF